MSNDVVAEPLRLVGAGVLGAAGHYLFRKVFKPGGGLNGSTARVLAELKEIKTRLAHVEGAVNGMRDRMTAGGL